MRQAFDSLSNDAEASTWASINWRRLAVHVYIANISEDIPLEVPRSPPFQSIGVASFGRSLGFQSFDGASFSSKADSR
jgi:hypothetical protein